MTLLQSTRILFAKELRIEMRTKEITVTTTLFGLLVTILASLSFYIDPSTAHSMAPGVLWLSIAFAGVLATGRAWARERENEVMRALMLAPTPRTAIYLSKATSVFAFLLVVEAILVPVVAVLFHVDLWPVFPRLLAILVLGTIGFVAAGTLFASLTVRTRARDLLLSVVIFPLVTPALLAAVVATRELFGGAPPGETLAWLRILFAFDLVFVVSGLVLFEPLVGD